MQAIDIELINNDKSIKESQFSEPTNKIWIWADTLLKTWAEEEWLIPCSGAGWWTVRNKRMIATSHFFALWKILTRSLERQQGIQWVPTFCASSRWVVLNAVVNQSYAVSSHQLFLRLAATAWSIRISTSTPRDYRNTSSLPDLLPDLAVLAWAVRIVCITSRDFGVTPIIWQNFSVLTGFARIVSFVCSTARISTTHLFCHKSFPA